MPPYSLMVSRATPYDDSRCKENGPLAHLLWILMFDDQQDQIGLMCLRVLVCRPIGCKSDLDEGDVMIR